MQNNTIESDRAFMKRTLKLLRDYDGRHESTNVVNCLLGLLIVPDDIMFTGIPDEPIGRLQGWGIGPHSVRRFGHGSGNGFGNGNGLGLGTSCENGGILPPGGHEPSLRDVVRALRHAVAGFGLRPHYSKGRQIGFEFHDEDLHVVLTTPEARSFVEKLTEHVAVQGHFGPYGAVVGARYIASWQREPFHLPGCSCLRRIRRQNLHGIKTREAAIEAGHRPCRVCKP